MEINQQYESIHHTIHYLSFADITFKICDCGEVADDEATDEDLEDMVESVDEKDEEQSGVETEDEDED
jgi:uncharacterized membrane-anchored protein